MTKIKKWWSDLKSFDWKMYLALCLLALVPAIYQTIITKLITIHTNPGALDIIGQMEWFDLINETICAFLIIPMYSILSKFKGTNQFSYFVFKEKLSKKAFSGLCLMVAGTLLMAFFK